MEDHFAHYRHSVMRQFTGGTSDPTFGDKEQKEIKMVEGLTDHEGATGQVKRFTLFSLLKSDSSLAIRVRRFMNLLIHLFPSKDQFFLLSRQFRSHILDWSENLGRI